MRGFRAVGDALALVSSLIDLRQIARWARISTNIAGAAIAVLLASFVAVALGLT